MAETTSDDKTNIITDQMFSHKEELSVRDPSTRANIGQQAKMPVQAEEDGTPFLEDETPLAKHIIKRIC
jgi:hypothetical protein